MRRDIAEELDGLLQEVGGKLDAALRRFEDTASPEEFAVACRAVDQVKDRLRTDILAPLQEAHPDLKPDTLTLRIPEPRLWFSQGDEDRFFWGLYALPAYVRVTMVGGGELELELKRPLDGYSLYDLTALLRRYGLDLSCLRAALPALRPKDRRWYRDPKRSWHNAVFKP